MRSKTYTSKWNLIGVSHKDRDKLYSRLRGLAKERLLQKHRKEYYIILKELLNQEYLRLKKICNGV